MAVSTALGAMMHPRGGPLSVFGETAQETGS